MSFDRALRHEIERWVENSAPPAPWLEHQAIAAVRARAEANRRTRSTWSTVRLAAPSVAALVSAVLVVGILIGVRVGGAASHPAPSRDPALVSYRARLDIDMHVVDFSFERSLVCSARVECASDLAQVRTATETLLSDISASETPSSVVVSVGRVKAAARQFIVQLDVALAVVQQLNSDYRAASGAPTPHDLDRAVADVDCWPATPVEGGHGISCS
jgi:hypothetical protein